MSEINTPQGWTVYHSSDAGQPDAHEEGWYYQPDDYDGGSVWSFCYASEAEAAAACRDEAAGAGNDDGPNAVATYIAVDEDVTREDIRQLRTEAGAAGDAEMVEQCTAALDGDDSAMEQCRRVILDVRAESAHG